MRAGEDSCQCLYRGRDTGKIQFVTRRYGNTRILRMIGIHPMEMRPPADEDVSTSSLYASPIVALPLQPSMLQPAGGTNQASPEPTPTPLIPEHVIPIGRFKSWMTTPSTPSSGAIVALPAGTTSLQHWMGAVLHDCGEPPFALGSGLGVGMANARIGSAESAARARAAGEDEGIALCIPDFDRRLL